MERMTDLYVLDPVGLVNFGEELRVGDGDHLVEPEQKFKYFFSHTITMYYLLGIQTIQILPDIQPG